MIAIDMKREHFTNGQKFSELDFDAYIQASTRFAKTISTRYLPCVFGGILVSFLFSKGIGGFTGNMMAVLCIFCGLVVGGIFNMKAGRAVQDCAAKLGITKADVAIARRHMKNGTVAWSNGDVSPVAVTRAEPGTQVEHCQDEPRTMPQQEAEAQQVAALPETPARALWAVGFALAAWLLLLVLQSVFGPYTAFSADALYLAVAALIGAAAYLVTRSSLKYRLCGAGAGLLAALISALSVPITHNALLYGQRVNLVEMFRLRSALFINSIVPALLFILLSLGAALLVSVLYKKTDKKRVQLSGGAAAAVYFVCNLAKIFAYPQIYLGSLHFINVFSAVLGILADAVSLFLVCVAVYDLCNMPAGKVKLHGIGLVWAWLATAGMAVSLIAAISAGTSSNPTTITYTAQFLLAAAGLAGYILLLCQRRVGLYVILIGTGVMLGAQLTTALVGVVYGASRYLPLFISYILGSLNPLFAYLAVKSSRKAGKDAASIIATRVENQISGFQKMSATLNVVAGIIGILFPLITMLNGAEFAGGMVVYMIVSVAFIGLGILLALRQRSISKTYGKGLHVLGGIAFGLGAALLLLSTVGILLNLVM